MRPSDRPPSPDTAADPSGGLLSVRNLVAGYGQGRSSATVVDDVSFDINRGQVVGVVGESGSGKSTLAAAVMGVLPTGGKRIAGSIDFAGRELTALSDSDMRRLRGNNIGFIPQNPMSALNPVLTIGSQLREAIDVHADARVPNHDERVAAALTAVGIADGREKVRNYPHELSGGMRQRALIAMSIINGPSLLIADEPTTALDVTIQAQVLDLLRGLIADRGMSMLLITHDMGVIAAMCDRVLVMYAGEIVEDGSAAEIFRRQRHPYASALLKSAGTTDPETRRFSAIAGAPAMASESHQGCRFRPRCDFAIDQCAEHPPLLTVMPEHSSRCWVAQDGGFDANNP